MLLLFDKGRGNPETSITVFQFMVKVSNGGLWIATSLDSSKQQFHYTRWARNDNMVKWARDVGKVRSQ